MLLTGIYHRTLDEKCRFAIPKPLRDAIGHPENSVLYLSPGTDGSLELFTEETFARLAEGLDRAPRNAKETRAFHRLFYAQVQRIELDGHGRARLPAELAELASVAKEIVLLGVRDHIEIWDRAKWESYLGDTQPHYDELAERTCPGLTRAAVAANHNEQPENEVTEEPSGSGSRPMQPR